ncbi:MAG: hypothetical protein UW83_C0025G0004 [Parcubacteria group bacterium GW2011_GWD1_44_9]|nr:MAG: hypothetical protein UV94_C0020G0008 [Parcubacteria group bacterium GW2011_GWC1_43_30]KKT85246.1 MAG: hypothetical protein UW83_C0025G0004 [Parcubacteria group bacterium GW2011_GWD1_44_9]
MKTYTKSNLMWISACVLMLIAIGMRVMGAGLVYAGPVMGAGIVLTFVWAWWRDRHLPHQAEHLNLH